MVSLVVMFALLLIKAAIVSTQQEENVLALFPEFKALSGRLEANTQNIAVNRKDVDSNSKNIDANTRYVAVLKRMKPHFFAILSNSLRVYNYIVIKFDQVITNIRNGYNKDTGVFTAPEDGVYVFGCTLEPTSRHKLQDYNIYKNNKLFRFVTHPPFAVNSNTHHMNLKKGDTVSIRHIWAASVQLQGGPVSYLFGYKLQ